MMASNADVDMGRATASDGAGPSSEPSTVAAAPGDPAAKRQLRPSHQSTQDELKWWSDQAGGSSEDFDSEDEAAMGLETAPPEFYDPTADVKDEEWVSKLRQGRKSDAILSCPACLTTVCVDCQQHQKDESQFRAMFVMNCRVDTSTQVKPKGPPTGKRRRRKDDDDQPAEEPVAEQGKFHPVLCGICGQDMGVWSTEEQMYHFFHVVPTNS